MKRRSFLTLCSAAAVVFGAQAQTTSKPNVVFIMADDLGWGSLGCYGAQKVETPWCDSLAESGLRFTDVHTPAALCTPTRYALMTGRYSWRTRLKKSVLFELDHSLIEPDRFTLADVFKQAGYRTGMVGKWHLGFQESTPIDYSKPLRPGPNELGFDYWFGIPGSHNLPPFVYVRNGEVVGRQPGEKVILDTSKPGRAKDRSTISDKRDLKMTGPRLAQEAAEFIQREHKQPFFLYLSTASVHSPITPCPDVQGTSQSGPYGDFIHQFDMIVGKTIKALKECGVFDNTLIIITSDNGGAVNFANASKIKWPINGPWRGMKSMLYEGGHRVSFIAHWPGHIPAGKDCAAPFSLVDMTASFAAFLNVELPKEASPDGINVMPALLGKTDKTDHPYMVFQSSQGHLAIRQGDWKLIDFAGGGGYKKPPKNAPKVQLYNLKDDPQEKNNLWEQYPEKVQALKALLEKEKSK